MAPEEPALHHSLGLLLVRRGQADAALVELGEATRLAPAETRYAYVYAVALHSMDRSAEALATLEEAHRRAPVDRELLQALATIHRDAGALPDALRYARKLLELSPDDPGVRQLVAQLESATAG